MITDPFFYLVALPAVGLYGLSKGGFGGVGMLAMPLLVLAVPPLEAVALMLPVLLIQDAVSVRVFWKKWDVTALKMLVPAGIFGIIIGSFLVYVIKTEHVKLLIGFISVSFCLHKWFLEKNTDAIKPHNIISAGFWGTIAGFTSYMIHAGGTPFNIYLLNKGLEKMKFAATAAIFFPVVNLCKIPSYYALGTLTFESLKTSLILFPWAIITNLAGVWLVKKVSEQSFRKVIYLLTFLVGCKLLYDGLI